eukprot:SAG31_NODE_4344_length_3330_cov_1.716496_2_plen_41_part_00
MLPNTPRILTAFILTVGKNEIYFFRLTNQMRHDDDLRNVP